MNNINVFINTDDILNIQDIPGFKPIYEYIKEPYYSTFEYDPREFGRIYFDNIYLTILAQSDIK